MKCSARRVARISTQLVVLAAKRKRFRRAERGFKAVFLGQAVAKWIHEGETVVITKRGLPFATLMPVRQRKALPSLDRIARLQKHFPNGPVAGDASAVLDYDRGDR